MNLSHRGARFAEYLLGLSGDPEDVTFPDDLGYWTEFPRILQLTTRPLPEPYVGTIIERPGRVAYIANLASSGKGHGHAGRQIEWLKEEYDVVVCLHVVNRVLARLLERRGFQRDENFVGWPVNRHVDCWVWRARGSAVKSLAPPSRLFNPARTGA